MKIKLLFVYSILTYTFCNSQGLNTDSIASENTVAATKLLYQKTIAGNSRLFNGIEYFDPLNTKKQIGHPYYFNDDWEEGFIHYDGHLFEHVYLRYNIYEDLVLIDHSESHATIRLITEKIKYFGLNHHIFLWLESDGDNIIDKGFYDLLYADKSKVIAKRYKIAIDNAGEKVMEVTYFDKTKLYLFKDEKYYPITKKKSALKAFGDYKSPMKKFLSQQKLNFKLNPEAALIAMAGYYDNLKK